MSDSLVAAVPMLDESKVPVLEQKRSKNLIAQAQNGYGQQDYLFCAWDAELRRAKLKGASVLNILLTSIFTFTLL
ncbi:hypothetical protein CDL15_Pgr006345 [Punica granatum]|uniref:Uncharacterized protein n=1 Tax=Punica granatum TaxID=22663 RepID=A0A218WBB5_PUNGR|nr:hypothetical protein CDL15_Pgr006345 [Punica granatum]